MNIFVGNLSFKTSEEELQREFEAFGEVNSAKIIIDRETLKSRGFAFVEMPDNSKALAAIAGMNGKELAGQVLKVNEARPREARTGQSRERTGGGFGGNERPSGAGGYGNRPRQGGSSDYGKGGDADIYDSKGRGRGGPGGRGRGGRGPGSGGRSGGGRRPH